MRIVPALQPIKDGHLRFGLALEAPAVEHFALERCEERFGHRVIERIPDGAHRRHDAGFAATLAESVAGVLGWQP